MAIADAYRQSLARLSGEGGALTAAQAAAPCNALDPAQLVQQAQQEEAIDNSTPGADRAPAEPLLDIVSADVSQGDCKVSMMNGGTYCDVTITLHVAFGTPALPAEVACYNMGTQQTVPLEASRARCPSPCLRSRRGSPMWGPTPSRGVSSW